MLKPEIRLESSVTIVTLGSEFETIEHTALVQFEKVLELASALEPPTMVINLGHTHYMDSAFLGLLLEVRRRLTSRPSGKFGICNALPHCRDVFAITKMDSLFDLYDSCEEAIAASSPKMNVRLLI